MTFGWHETSEFVQNGKASFLLTGFIFAFLILDVLFEGNMTQQQL